MGPYMSDSIETNAPKLDLPPRRHRGRFLLPLIALGELAAIGYLLYPSGLPALQLLPPKREILRIEAPRLSWKSGPDDCGPFSPDGNSLVSGNLNGLTTFWDPLTGQKQATIPYGAFCAAFAPDNQTLAIGQLRRIVLWDLGKGKERAILNTSVCSLAYSPNGEILAAGTYMEGVTLWNPADGKQRAHLRAEIREPSIMFSPDGQTLACGGSDGLVRLWDVTTHKERRLGKGAGTFVGFTPDGQTLISGRYDGVVRLWDVPTGNKRGMRQASDNVSRMALTADGRTLALALLHKRTLELWDVPTGRTRAILGGQLDSVDSLAFSPDGRTLAIATGGVNNSAISLWDVPP
jgi:WD40 repeat protein